MANALSLKGMEKANTLLFLECRGGALMRLPNKERHVCAATSVFLVLFLFECFVRDGAPLFLCRERAILCGLGHEVGIKRGRITKGKKGSHKALFEGGYLEAVFGLKFMWGEQTIKNVDLSALEGPWGGIRGFKSQSGGLPEIWTCP